MQTWYSNFENVLSVKRLKLDDRLCSPAKHAGSRKTNRQKKLKTKLPEKVDGGQYEDRRHFNKGELAEYCRDQMLHLCPPSLYLSFEYNFSLSKNFMYVYI